MTLVYRPTPFVRLHSQERALLTDSCIEWHTNVWYASVFTQGNDLPWNPQALFGCQCAKNRVIIAH
jgi:hypothetical protein